MGIAFKTWLSIASLACKNAHTARSRTLMRHPSGVTCTSAGLPLRPMPAAYRPLHDGHQRGIWGSYLYSLMYASWRTETVLCRIALP